MPVVREQMKQQAAPVLLVMPQIRRCWRAMRGCSRRA
jgi:hypothetical protein